jgi:hypothetical protein
LPDGRRLLQVLGSTQSVIADASIADLVRRTLSFRTVSGHAATLAKELGLDREEAEDIARELSALVTAGVLIEEKPLLEKIRTHTTEATTLGGLTIFAADRPELLARCARSACDALRTFGRILPLAISDDARDPAVAARHQAIATELGATYAGREIRAEWAKKLAREAVLDPQLTADLLLGHPALRTNGASRNAALLDGLDRSHLFADDDTIFSFGAPWPSDQDLELSSFAELTELHLFTDRKSALAAAKLGTHDGFLAHEQLLGSAPGNLSKNTFHADEASPALLRRLSNCGGTVRVTMMGMAGDSGMGSPAYYLSRKGEFRRRLLANYPGLRDTREVVRCAKRRTVTDNSFLMTACAGFDGRGYLPPFFPIQRNSDGLFARALRTVDPGALFGHLPLVIAHEPEPRTASFERTLSTFGNTRLDELYFAVIEATSLSGWPGSPEERSLRLGMSFIEHGRLAPTDFYDFARRARSQKLIAGIARLESILEEHDREPEIWAADLERAVEEMYRGLERPQLPLPIDLLGENRLGVAQHWLESYGRILVSWPAIRSAARTLYAREEGLFRSDQR